MMEHRLDGLLETYRLLELSKQETIEEVAAYWWFADYTACHNPRPKDDLCTGIGYAGYRFSEAYRFSQIRLQRTFDLWQEQKKDIVALNQADGHP
jgi:hypothetical protein